VSQENVEVVKRAVDAVSRRPKPDFDVVNALLTLGTSLIRALRGWKEPRFPASADSVNGSSTWTRWEWKLVRATDVGGDRVLVVASITAHSRLGGSRSRVSRRS
jgi:hypothetical protein